MTEPVDATLPLRRGFVRVGGRPVIQHQLDVAIALECERVICLVRSLEPDVISLQKRAEATGMRFHTATSPRDLSALVTAADDLIVLYEGLLIDPGKARELLAQGNGVFVQPVETGLAAGFERIDINHASAGLMRIPGRLVDGLMQLPPDCDVPSALVRIALQAGVEAREVPAEARNGMRWQIVTSESNAYAIEQEWLLQRLGSARAISPGGRLARIGVSAFGSPLLHAGNASLLMAAATLFVLALGIAAGWLGYPATSFLLSSLSWIVLNAAQMLKRLEQPAAGVAASGSPGLQPLAWGFDAALILLIHWAAPPIAGTSIVLSLALPVTFLLLVRLCSIIPGMPGATVIADRALLSLLLALFAGIGIVDWGVALATVVLASALLAMFRPAGG